MKTGAYLKRVLAGVASAALILVEAGGMGAAVYADPLPTEVSAPEMAGADSDAGEAGASEESTGGLLEEQLQEETPEETPENNPEEPDPSDWENSQEQEIREEIQEEVQEEIQEEVPESVQEEYTESIAESIAESVPESWDDVTSSTTSIPESVFSMPEDVISEPNLPKPEPTTTSVPAMPQTEGLISLVGAPLTLDMTIVKETLDKTYLETTPHIYLYLKRKAAEGDSSTGGTGQLSIDAHYLIKLAYNKTDLKLSAVVGDILTGSYDVSYYTAAFGKSDECDAQATNPSTGQITDAFIAIAPGAVFAGGSLKLGDTAPTVITVAAEQQTESLGTLSYVGTAVKASVFKKISGTSSASNPFYFDLYRMASPTETTLTDAVVTNVPTTGTITEAAGQELLLAKLAYTEPGDYYYAVRENDTGKVDYITYDTTPRVIHIKVVQGTNGELSVAQVETKGDRGYTVSLNNLTPGAFDITGVNELYGVPTESRDAEAARYTYEFYGPYASESEANPESGSYDAAKKIGETAKLEEGDENYQFKLSTTSLHTGSYYALVEKHNGKVNRNKTVILVPHVTEGGVSWALSSPIMTVTNVYAYKAVQKTITLKTTVSGSPKSKASFPIVLRNNSGTAITTVTLKGASTGGVKLNFRAPGIYTYRITETKGSAAGYTYDTSTHVVRFTVTDGGKGELDFVITVDDTETTDPTVTFNNSYSVGVRIYLLNATNHYLTGGKLRVTNSSGKKIDTWDTENTYHTVHLTADGKYTITEVTAPADYIKSDPVTFTIENGKIKNSSSKAIRITNTMASGPFSFTKVNAENGNGVQGATYALYRIRANKGTSAYKTAAANLSKGKIVWDELGGIATQTSGSGGGVGFSNLGPNTYYVIRETKAAPGYQKSADSAIIKTVYENNSWSVDVIYGASGTLVRAGSGYAWKEYPTKVVVNVRSSSGAYLKGAKLQLTDTSTNRVIETWESGSTGHQIKATMVIGNRYKLEQTNKLKGYTNSNPITFTVAAKDATTSSPVQYVTFTDQKSSGSVTPTPTGSGGGGGGGGGSGTVTPSGSITPTGTVTPSGSITPTGNTTSSSTTNGTKKSTNAATGDNAPIIPLALIMCCAAAVILFVLLRRKS